MTKATLNAIITQFAVSNGKLIKSNPRAAVSIAAMFLSGRGLSINAHTLVERAAQLIK